MPTGFLVLLAIAVACAALLHWRLPRFWLATLLNAPLTVAVFLAVASVQSGFPDPLEVKPLVYFAGFGLVVAAQVGAVFLLVRHRRREQP